MYGSTSAIGLPDLLKCDKTLLEKGTAWTNLAQSVKQLRSFYLAVLSWAKEMCIHLI